MDKHERLLEELAVVIHGTLATLHGVAAVHHLRRADRSWKHFGVHIGGAAYSTLSVLHHLKKLRGQDE